MQVVARRLDAGGADQIEIGGGRQAGRLVVIHFPKQNIRQALSARVPAEQPLHVGAGQRLLRRGRVVPPAIFANPHPFPGHESRLVGGQMSLHIIERRVEVGGGQILRVVGGI